MSNKAVIAGVGMTRFGRALDRTTRDLAGEATTAALADASITPADVEMVFFANAVGGLYGGQEMVRGEVALRASGLLGTAIVNVENACASGSSAVLLARQAVMSGQVDVALAIGAEKLVHEDRAVSFRSLNTAVDLEEIGTAPDDRSLYIGHYAAVARHAMATTDLTRFDFAEVAAKNHLHGLENPHAQYGMKLSAEEVLASRVVDDPLTVMMCSPLSDGAAAVVVMSAERFAGGPAVHLAGAGLRTGSDRTGKDPATFRAAHVAYEQAGIAPSEIDVIELHDAAASAEPLLYEQLGLCAPGDGVKLLRDGVTRIGGRVPVNPSGGLLSKGHPIGASGCAQVVELYEQLKGRSGSRQVDGARVAVSQNAGGWIGDDNAVSVVLVLMVDQ
ncbi:MAG: thiolase family protein [Actinomycetota bacterium]|nr:thiolase family protein [Actinomycetota bacterium]MDA3028608.1 thiolase family protein [Actinomycetota bacterium]